MNQRATPRLARRLPNSPQFWFGAVVLLPLLAWYIVFAFMPIVRTFLLSLQTFNALNPALSRFSGLRNYTFIFSDPRFLTALQNSFVYMLIKNAMAIPLALLLAVLLERTRHRQFYMFAFFLPTVTSILGTAVLFKYFYDPTVGLFNALLESVGLPGQPFIRSESQALASVAAMDAWKSFGFYTLLLVAGILNIPETLYDAAKIDGANGRTMFFRITMPLLSRTLLLVFVIAGIDGFQVFAAPYILAGPGRSTLVLAQLIYNEGLTNLNLGYAAAASFVLFVIILAISLLQLRLVRSDWEY